MTDQQIDMGLVREFIDLTAQQRDLEAQLASVNEKLAPFQDKLLVEWQKIPGFQRTSLAGWTVYLERKVWAQYPEGRAAAIEALKEAGLAKDYVKEDFNHQSLSSYVREAEDELPDEFEGKIRPVEVFKIKAVRA